MDLIKITDKVMNTTFGCINIAARAKYCLDYPHYKNILARNEKFKNIEKGKTCYILGNGPSLKQLDPMLLQGKDVLTVNALLTTEMFDILTPKYHCIVDRGVYASYQNEVRKRVETTSTAFFFHRKLYDELSKYDNAYYLYGTLTPVNKNVKTDITKNAGCFINVIPCTIMLALYLGYEKVILLGCDFSFFAVRKDMHFYDSGGTKPTDTMFSALLGASIMYEQLSYIAKYAADLGIKIYNATPGSLLDVFPQETLEKLI